MTLREFVRKLELSGELQRISEPVSTVLEITEITDRISKQPSGGKALLFENVGKDFPVLINAMGSKKRMKIVLGGKHPEELSSDLTEMVNMLGRPHEGFSAKLALLPQLNRVSSWMPKKVKGRGSCQHAIQDSPDLDALPVLTCWPYDGGPFITLPMVHTQDPVTEQRNLGMYRMQVFTKDETGMHWQIHKTGAKHYRGYKKVGNRMPVTVTLGGDPIYTYCATAPLPEGLDEYILAGFLRQKPVNLVKCLTNDLWIPEDVDFVIEGFVDPSERMETEGPFGDHTGFYSLEDQYPVFHVTAITHRKGAIYPATIVGVPPQEDNYFAWVTERLFMPAIKMTLIPELIDLHMPPPGVAHNLVLMKISPDYPGHARKVIHAVWGAGQMMFTKVAVIMPEEINLNDGVAVMRAISERVDPIEHVEFGYGPLDALDHAASKPFEGGKMGIDATGEILPQFPKNFLEIEQTTIFSFRSSNPEIYDLYLDWLHEGISVGLVSVMKTRPGIVKELADEIRLTDGLNRVRFWAFFDDNTDLRDMNVLIWIFGSHTDISRDVWVTKVPGELPYGILFADCTRKSKKMDGFIRPWPNPVLMDEATISKVDRIWPKLKLGAFIESPTKKLRKLEENMGAVVLE